MELTVEQALQQGIAAHKEGKLQEAEQLYRAILNTQPSHPDANHNLGVIGISYGRFEESVPFFQKAISINDTQEQYWVSLIEALMKLGKIHAARKVLSEAAQKGLQGDKIESISLKLHPITKLEFFYTYLEKLGVFASQDGDLLNGQSEAIPLLTNSFLDWFETQNWNSMRLLELGAGGSTLYFSKFFKTVKSCETNQDWYEKLKLKIPENVSLIKVESILNALQKNQIEDVLSFDVILLDAGENRAKLARWLINKKYKGIVFFDNSDWYRKSISIFVDEGFLEIPFFGIKPVEDWVSCTSIVAEPSALSKILKPKWVSVPKLVREELDNRWDDESE